jgi:RNA-directed DNA polymerase
MLCNIALNGLENAIREEFPPRKTINGKRPKVDLIRYADDLIVTGENKEFINKAKIIIDNFLKTRDLELKPDKTRIITIYEGFDFLGFNISRKPFNNRLNKNTKQTTVLIIKP